MFRFNDICYFFPNKVKFVPVGAPSIKSFDLSFIPFGKLTLMFSPKNISYSILIHKYFHPQYYFHHGHYKKQQELKCSVICGQPVLPLLCRFTQICNSFAVAPTYCVPQQIMLLV